MYEYIVTATVLDTEKCRSLGECSKIHSACKKDIKENIKAKNEQSAISEFEILCKLKAFSIQGLIENKRV